MCLFFLFALFNSCREAEDVDEPTLAPQISKYCRNLFKQQFTYLGEFGSDSLEYGTWSLIDLDNPITMHGNFSKGLQIGEWEFLTGEEGVKRWTVSWNQYQNSVTNTSFSIPFEYEESQIDSNFYRLWTNNQLLGELSIIVGVKNQVLTEQEIAEIRNNVDYGLQQQGYAIQSLKDSITEDNRKYYSSTYKLTSANLQSSTLYNVLGYTTSGSSLVEISFFHSGAKPELARLIFASIANNFYVGKARLFSPFLDLKIN
jgi:hypothetical protein